MKEAIIYYDQVAQTLNEKFDKMSGVEGFSTAISVIGSDMIKKSNGFFI